MCCLFNDVFSNRKHGYCTVWNVMCNHLCETCKRGFFLSNFKALNVEVTKENYEDSGKNEGMGLLSLQFI